jgi:F-type H+-transporting ATPase subunit delta
MRTTRRAARAAKQLFRLCLVNGRIDRDRAARVVTLMLQARRRGAFPVLTELQRLVRLDRDRRSARVESAAPLSDDLKAAVEASVAQLYGHDMEVTFADDPALIGGMRLAVGSDVFDGSVRARLREIERRL